MCGKDVDVAALKLLNDGTFNQTVIETYGDIMICSQFIGPDLFGFGTKMDVVANRFECYVLEESLE